MEPGNDARCGDSVEVGHQTRGKCFSREGLHVDEEPDTSQTEPPDYHHRDHDLWNPLSKEGPEEISRRGFQDRRMRLFRGGRLASQGFRPNRLQLASRILNTMTRLGMPDSYRVA